MNKARDLGVTIARLEKGLILGPIVKFPNLEDKETWPRHR
jgi:hypothetical protein